MLIIFLIYFILKLFIKTPADDEIPHDVKNYSRELQNIKAIDDDSVLDLTQAA